MENPATWTPLHHEIHDAYYSEEFADLDVVDPKRTKAAYEVLIKHNYDVSLTEIEVVCQNFYSDMRCGLSLPSTLINKFADRVK